MIHIATNRHQAHIAEIMGYIRKRASDRKFRKSRRRFGTLLIGERGTVGILVALGASALVMALAVGVEVTGWTVKKLRLQRTADMAAIAAALAYSSGASAQVAAAEAAYLAEINGGVGSTTRPPHWDGTATLSDNMITIQKIAGVINATDVAFQAQIQQNFPLLFSAIALSGTKTLTATAKAEIQTTTTTSQIGKYCVLALDTSPVGITLDNNAMVDTSQCGVQANTTGANSAITLEGSAVLEAANVAVSTTTSPCNMAGPGTYSCPNSARLVVTTSGISDASAGANPYATVPVPAAGTNCLSAHAFNQTISPGTYCNGLSIDYGTVNMQPGVYLITSGSFTPAGGSTVNATGGVTIVLTGGASMQIGNNATVNLTAPTSGTYQGLAILQGAASGTNNIQGGSVVNINGAMVFPLSVVDFSNGTTTNSVCTALIAYQVIFTGGAKFNNNCSGTGTIGIGAPTTITSTTSLVQ